MPPIHDVSWQEGEEWWERPTGTFYRLLPSPYEPIYFVRAAQAHRVRRGEWEKVAWWVSMHNRAWVMASSQPIDNPRGGSLGFRWVEVER